MKCNLLNHYKFINLSDLADFEFQKSLIIEIDFTITLHTYNVRQMITSISMCFNVS